MNKNGLEEYKDEICPEYGEVISMLRVGSPFCNDCYFKKEKRKEIK
jgi:hypothetical protein